MLDSGWIKLYRKVQKSDMYKSLNSKQRDVMIQCLLFANRFEYEWEWKKEICKCKPGQFITSLLSLKKVCAKDVSLQNIRTALLKLEKWCFLTNVSTKAGRLITICKWSIYQSNPDETNKETNKALTKHQQSTNKALTSNKSNKKDKSDKNNKKEKNIYVCFDEFWKLYPKRGGRKVGKQECSNWWRKNVTSEEIENQIMNAVKTFANCDKAKKGFAEDPIRFLKHKRYLDYGESIDNSLDAWGNQKESGVKYDKYGIPEFSEVGT